MSRNVYLDTVLTVDSAGGIPLTAEWSYRSDDPYAVTLTVQDGDVEQSWSFARDLLDVGMMSGTAMGIGDIRIWTCDNEELHIFMTSPFGTAQLTLDHGDAVDFICATFDAVPEGDEEHFMDLDGEIEELLKGAA